MLCWLLPRLEPIGGVQREDGRGPSCLFMGRGVLLLHAYAAFAAAICSYYYMI